MAPRPSPARPRVAALLAAALVAAALAAPASAAAHALTGKADLPIPEWLFVWAAALVLIVSFVALTVAWRTPRLEEPSWRPAPEALSRALVNPVSARLAGAVGVGLLVLVVYAGLAGVDDASQNFAPTFLYVTFWLALVPLSVLLGDVLRPFNPWRAIGRTVSAGMRRLPGSEPPQPLPYPDWLGRWPAAAGIAAFLWMELAYRATEPSSLAVATLAYSAATFVAMGVYGVDRWIERGEAFSVYFNMFSRLSAVEVRDGRLGFRRPLSGMAGWGSVPGSVPLVLLIIGATTYDGAYEGPLQEIVPDTFRWIADLGLDQTTALRINDTLYLVAAVAAVAAVFWLGVRGMHTIRTSLSTRSLGRSFGHALIPIGLAYLFAHYFSLVVFQEQAQFTYLLSDPLGRGSNLFGTASGGIDYGAVSATAVWYVQVASLVAGHVTGLVIAHDRALVLYSDPDRAARSQYWMLGVMVAFTCLGLYLLSQANQ